MKILCTLLCLTALAGCGPTVKLSPDYNERKPNQLIAVLPVVAETEVPKEHLQFLRDSLVAELRNSEYLVLDRDLVDEYCPTSSSSCSNLDNLLEAYDLSGAFELTVTDYGHTGFLIGFYSTVGGQLNFLSEKGNKLFTMEHQESKRGGLLFNSGQLLTAIRNQIDSGSTNKKEELERKFVRSLIADLPEINPSEMNFSPPKIQTAEITNLSDLGRTKFCVNADSTVKSHIYVGRVKADLRPESTERHCAVYSSDLFEECDVKFVVATRFGDASVKTVKRDDCDA